VTVDMSAGNKQLTISFNSPKLGAAYDQVTLDLTKGQIVKSSTAAVAGARSGGRAGKPATKAKVTAKAKVATKAKRGPAPKRHGK